MSARTLADRLGDRIARATLALAPAAEREWLRALQAEAHAVPRGWRRVAWLAGGARFAITLRTETLMQASGGSFLSSPLGRHAVVVAFFLACWGVGVRAVLAALPADDATRDRAIGPLLLAILLATLAVALWRRARWAVIAAIGCVVQGLHVVLLASGRPELQGWDGMMAPFFAGMVAAVAVLVPWVRERLVRATGGTWPVAAIGVAIVVAEAIAHRNLMAGVLPFRSPWMHAVIVAAGGLGVMLALAVRARLERADGNACRELASA